MLGASIVNRKNINGLTLLHVAAMENDLAKVKKLISLGADINIEDNLGNTPLSSVAFANQGDSHYKVAETLLKNGAEVNKGFVVPLNYLIDTTNLKFLRLFLNFKAEINPGFIDKKMTLLFQAAARSENVKIVPFLINDLGFDVNHRNIVGQTPMHKAGECIGYGNIKNMKFLLKCGADINALDHYGLTPLNWALNGRYFLLTGKETNEKDLKFLIEHSNVNLINSEGHSILSPERETQRLCKILLKHLAKMETLDAFSVHPVLLTTIANKNEYNDYYERCKEELLRAKSTKLENSWVTFYHLLVGSKRRLKNYAGNKDLIKDYKKTDRMEKFPIYGSWMDENVQKGIKRRKVFDKSSALLSKCLPIYDSYHLTVRDILDCLSTKDLTKLCDKKRKKNCFF